MIVAAIIIVAAILIIGRIALRIPIAAEAKKRADAPGNAEAYRVENLEKHPDSILTGKSILFLGSSVTYGAAAEGQSFVELFAYLDGVNAIKEAKSGTTLADKPSVSARIAFGNGDSYIKRLKAIDPGSKIDCVVCQLSTNDATMKLPLGEIGPGRELDAFDVKTITGAMEYIIRYCQNVWNCPVVFYTGSWYESAEYQAMVERLHELRDKWGIGLIDLYSDEKWNAISRQAYDLYMFDAIHPTKAGYLHWWMPKMEKELAQILAD